MKTLLKALLVLLTIPLYGQTGLGTAGQQEYARALTNGGKYGAPRFTTTQRDSQRPCNTSNLGGIIWNTTTSTEQVCDGSAWASVAAGAVTGNLVMGTSTDDCATAGGVFFDLSGKVQCDADIKFVGDTLTITKIVSSTSWTLGSTTTAGTATSVFDAAIGGASATDNILNVTGTFPTSLSAETSAVSLLWTTGGSSNQITSGLKSQLAAGTTSIDSDKQAIYGLNAIAVGGNFNSGLSMHSGVKGEVTASASQYSAGLYGKTSASGAGTAGLLGLASGGSATYGVGVVGVGNNSGPTNAAGGLFLIGATFQNLAGTAAIVLGNGSAAVDILRAFDNTTLVTTIQDGGSQWQSLGATTLTESSATAFVQVAVTSNGRQGGMIYYCVDASDASDFQERCGNVPIALVNKAGTETCTVGTPADVVAVSTGTLTVTFDTDTSPTNACNFRANAVSSLTQTTLRINSQVVLYGNAANAVTKQ